MSSATEVHEGSLDLGEDLPESGTLADRVTPPWWRRTVPVALPVGIFAASRMATLAVAYMASLLPPGEHWTALLSKWDGGWYISIATSGYPEHVPAGHGAAAQNTTGFFPAYAMLMKAASRVTGWSYRTTGLVIALTAGAAAAAVLWALVARLADPATASRSVALFSFFPSAFIFSMVYAESTLIFFAALCLLCLVSERWLLAGAAAAAAGAVRPNGSVLVLCCLWAAVVAVRRDRSWRPLIAPLLAPVGVVAFFVYLRVHTGDAFAFIRSNHRGWNQGFDFGVNTAHKLWTVVQHPQADFNQLVSALSIGFVGVALVLLWLWKPPFTLVIYALGILGLALLSTELTSTSRYVLTSFPLLIAVARRVRGPAFVCLLGVSAVLMGALLMLSSTTLALTP